MIQSFDLESTGLDLAHGALPYFATWAKENGTVDCWEWRVNPLTRKVTIPPADLDEIKRRFKLIAGWGRFKPEVQEHHVLVGQNISFDMKALAAVGVEDFPWPMVRDTLHAGHLLASNQPHNLTDMVLAWLGIDIEPFELRLEKATKEARTFAKRHCPAWRLAKKGEEDMPSVKGKAWKQDAWLPKTLRDFRFARPLDKKFTVPCQSWEAVVKRNQMLPCDEGDPLPGLEGHEDWDTVLRDYANIDSISTLRLWLVMREEIKRRGLWDIYMKFCLPRQRVAFLMERRGLTINRCRLEELDQLYRQESEKEGAVCVSVARSLGVDLELPKSGNNDSLIDFVFGPLKMPPLKWTPGGANTPPRPAFDKFVFEEYLTTLPPNTKQLLFIKQLHKKRKRDTALGYLESYRRFWLPVVDASPGDWSQEWMRLHSNLNITGSNTLRSTSSNPNSQQFSKQESECWQCNGNKCEHCGFTGIDKRSLRWVLGPMPGREWWSLDTKNIERRIPAYEAGEEEIIALLEQPHEPPYYGSEHAMVAHMLFPDLFERCKNDRGELDANVFKKNHKDTHYQWVKNGNFALQYGCQARKADATFHCQGAYGKLKQRFRQQDALNQAMIRMANKRGFVETIPDKSIDPNHGYPIWCSRAENGFVLPTVPFCYHVSGTACWAAMRWMVDTQRLLDTWQQRERFDGAIVLMVHDELVMDFPARGDPTKHTTTLVNGVDINRDADNLWRVREIQGLLAKIGDDLGVPLLSGCEWHSNNWAMGESI